MSRLPARPRMPAPLVRPNVRPAVVLPRPPDVIPVPICDGYRGLDGKQAEFLTAHHGEGWKLHIPLLDNGYLWAGSVTFWRDWQGTRVRRKMEIFQYYYGSPASERQDDEVIAEDKLMGYVELFVWLQKQKIAHKFVPTVSQLRQIERDQPEQKGKWLTIYPTGQQEMFKIIAQAEICLNMLNHQGFFKFSKQFETGDRRVPPLNIITARYGSFVDSVVLKPSAQRPAENAITMDNCHLHTIPDDRSVVKPAHIRDPWTGQPATGDMGWYIHNW